MYQSISQHGFTEAFRLVRPNNFSYTGLLALFDYLEEYEDSTGEKIELDVIAVCCDFTEYENFEAFLLDYGTVDDFDDMDAVRDYTSVIETRGDNFIIQTF